MANPAVSHSLPDFQFKFQEAYRQLLENFEFNSDLRCYSYFRDNVIDEANHKLIPVKKETQVLNSEDDGLGYSGLFKFLFTEEQRKSIGSFKRLLLMKAFKINIFDYRDAGPGGRYAVLEDKAGLRIDVDLTYIKFIEDLCVNVEAIQPQLNTVYNFRWPCGSASPFINHQCAIKELDNMTALIIAMLHVIRPDLDILAFMLSDTELLLKFKIETSQKSITEKATESEYKDWMIAASRCNLWADTGYFTNPVWRYDASVLKVPCENLKGTTQYTGLNYYMKTTPFLSDSTKERAKAVTERIAKSIAKIESATLNGKVRVFLATFAESDKNASLVKNFFTEYEQQLSMAIVHLLPVIRRDYPHYNFELEDVNECCMIAISLKKTT